MDSALGGVLSSSDFKNISESNLPLLASSVKDHMTKDPLTCTLDTPLRDIIELFASSGVHRVFVVEGFPKRVVGVVSMTDIMKLLVPS